MGMMFSIKEEKKEEGGKLEEKERDVVYVVCWFWGE